MVLPRLNSGKDTNENASPVNTLLERALSSLEMVHSNFNEHAACVVFA